MKAESLKLYKLVLMSDRDIVDCVERNSDAENPNTINRGAVVSILRTQSQVLKLSLDINPDSASDTQVEIAAKRLRDEAVRQLLLSPKTALRVINPSHILPFFFLALPDVESLLLLGKDYEALKLSRRELLRSLAFISKHVNLVHSSGAGGIIIKVRLLNMNIFGKHFRTVLEASVWTCAKAISQSMEWTDVFSTVACTTPGTPNCPCRQRRGTGGEVWDCEGQAAWVPLYE